MIGLLLALAVQASPEAADPAPLRVASDPCIELQGGGKAIIGGERLSGRALSKAVAGQVPPGRPLFILFANPRAKNDIQGMATVMTAAPGASAIVLVDTCELPTGDIGQ